MEKINTNIEKKNKGNMINKRNANQNTCDKCQGLFDTEELVWITSEDFTPKEGEKLPASAYKIYDALCERCYLSIINCIQKK